MLRKAICNGARGLQSRTANLLGALALALADAQMEASRRATGLGASACAALVTIGQYPGLTIGGLSHVLGISHSVAVRLVDSLSRAQLLERSAGAEDKRQVALTLSSTGDAQMRVIFDQRHEQAEHAMAGLAPSDQAALAALLAHMLASMTHNRREADHICRYCEEASCPQDICPVALMATKCDRGAS